MEQNFNTPFIFYLSMEEELPKSFYIFDKCFKELGYILLPVKIDQLQMICASAEQNQIIVLSSITDSREMRMYNERVRNVLKYILKSKRLTMMVCSSFSKLNDFRMYSMMKNYFFLKYPLSARELAKKIVRYHDLKSEQNTKWPGGRRTRLGTTA